MIFKSKKQLLIVFHNNIRCPPTKSSLPPFLLCRSSPRHTAPPTGRRRTSVFCGSLPRNIWGGNSWTMRWNDFWDDGDGGEVLWKDRKGSLGIYNTNMQQDNRFDSGWDLDPSPDTSGQSGGKPVANKIPKQKLIPTSGFPSTEADFAHQHWEGQSAGGFESHKGLQSATGSISFTPWTRNGFW